MTTRPTNIPRHPADVAYEIYCLSVDYVAGRISTDQMYARTQAVIEADRQAIRHDERQAIAREASGLVDGEDGKCHV